MPEESIQYTIRKSKRAKRLRLAVYCDGSIIVTTPVGVQQFIIHDFILEKRQWIYEKLRFFRSVNRKVARTFSQDDYMLYRKQALEFVIQRVEHFMKIYGHTYNEINIKNQKKRWGSCSKKGNLNFNYKIIFLPEAVRDYIVVHEICHLMEFNHSKKFWHLVEKALPEYTDIKKQLQSFDLVYK